MEPDRWKSRAKNLGKAAFVNHGSRLLWEPAKRQGVSQFAVVLDVLEHFGSLKIRFARRHHPKDETKSGRIVSGARLSRR